MSAKQVKDSIIQAQAALEMASMHVMFPEVRAQVQIARVELIRALANTSPRRKATV